MFERQILLKILHFYRELGYTTKGAPDLFLVRNGSFWFAEVKTINDWLSPEQYRFVEGFLKTVGDNITVLRVLPE